jgi:pyruvate dehydrogenase E1 component
VTSPDRLFVDWNRQGARSHIAALLRPLARDARLVTVLDGHPATLSWIGGVRGQQVTSLGVVRFGQSGDIPDLYRTHGIEAEAIAQAALAP